MEIHNKFFIIHDKLCNKFLFQKLNSQKTDGKKKKRKSRNRLIN